MPELDSVIKCVLASQKCLSKRWESFEFANKSKHSVEINRGLASKKSETISSELEGAGEPITITMVLRFKGTQKRETAGSGKVFWGALVGDWWMGKLKEY